MSYIDQIEEHIDNFPEMPSLSGNLLAYLDDPDVDFRIIKDMVQYDPGLTANVSGLPIRSTSAVPGKSVPCSLHWCGLEQSGYSKWFFP
jgi:hypothetical protein